MSIFYKNASFGIVVYIASAGIAYSQGFGQLLDSLNKLNEALQQKQPNPISNEPQRSQQVDSLPSRQNTSPQSGGTIADIRYNGDKMTFGGESILEIRFEEGVVQCNLEVGWGLQFFRYTITPNLPKSAPNTYRFKYKHETPGQIKLVVRGGVGDRNAFPACKIAKDPFEVTTIQVLTQDETKVAQEQQLREREEREKRAEDAFNAHLAKTTNPTTYIICRDRYRTGGGYEYIKTLGTMVARNYDFQQIEGAVEAGRDSYSCNFRKIAVAKNAISYRNSELIAGVKGDLIIHNIDGEYSAVLLPN